MKGSKCTKNFPKKYCSSTMFDDCGFPIYRRRKTKHTVKVRNTELDNQWVVPYNRDLLVRYQCHINIEICKNGRCMKYLFKYCLKGHDRATVMVQSEKRNDQQSSEKKIQNEIKTYLDGRYICGPEVAHRIFGFDVHHRSMSVERLPFHLENGKYVTFKSTDSLDYICQQAAKRNSKLEAFFQLCQENVDARKYIY
ncbi:uncharacterized protein LOC141720795 isoform X1 [Apium graveolens]|uniref:uncharacterized protein LOC141720795 isoform X1 n=1 Tax=Apium graveolens TaxID=4045 RepID=UPI003D792F17